MRPQLTADALAVRIPIADRAAPLLDELALAYAADPVGVGRLLAAHAATVDTLERAATNPAAAGYGRALTAADAEAARGTLLARLPDGDQLDAELTAAEAIRLADDLTATAARIRLAPRSRPV